MLKLVIPKGSLEEQTLRLFEAADLRVRRAPTATTTARSTTTASSASASFGPQEIPLYVQDGLFDLGITGQDWIAETGADVEVLTTLSLREDRHRPRHADRAGRARTSTRRTARTRCRPARASPRSSCS